MKLDRCSGVAAVALATGITAQAKADGECEVQQTPQVIWLEDTIAPGTESEFQRFDRPCASPDGHIAFTGDLAGSTMFDDVLYRGSVLIGREGDAAPGTNGVFDDFEVFQTSSQAGSVGAVCFIATLREVPIETDRVLYQNETIIAREGSAVPGLPGHAIESLESAGMTSDGRVGFVAGIDGPSSQNAVMILDGELMYRKGDPVPGMAPATWDGRFEDVQWGPNGNILFEGNTSLAAAGDRVVLLRRVNSDGTISQVIVAQEGQMLDSEDDAAPLDLIEQLALGADGVWAGRGLVRGATTLTDDIVFGANGILAREGDSIDAIPGATVGRISGVAVGPQGQIAWIADITAGPPAVSEGIFVDGCLVVTTGTEIASLNGTWLVDLGFEDLTFDHAGDIVFAAGYAGQAVGDGLFRVTPGPSSCPGDLDHDGVVGILDLAQILSTWGNCGEALCPGDIDGDGVIGFSDLVTLAAAWGDC